MAVRMLCWKLTFYVKFALNLTRLLWKLHRKKTLKNCVLASPRMFQFRNDYWLFQRHLKPKPQFFWKFAFVFNISNVIFSLHCTSNKLFHQFCVQELVVGTSFVVLRSTAFLSRRKRAVGGTSRDGCCAQDNYERNALYSYSTETALIWKASWYG
jgi:hypothetical protein